MRKLQNARARREILDWGQKVVPEEHLKMVKQIAVDVLVEAKRRTPRRTGRLQRSWTISLQDPRGVKVRLGQRLVDLIGDTGSAALRRLKPFQKVYIVNPDFRASWHEWGTVHHGASPMLRPALAAVRDRIVKVGDAREPTGVPA